jgi:hypothetical protein
MCPRMCSQPPRSSVRVSVCELREMVGHAAGEVFAHSTCWACCLPPTHRGVAPIMLTLRQHLSTAHTALRWLRTPHRALARPLHPPRRLNAQLCQVEAHSTRFGRVCRVRWAVALKRTGPNDTWTWRCCRRSSLQRSGRWHVPDVGKVGGGPSGATRAVWWVGACNRRTSVYPPCKQLAAPRAHLARVVTRGE